MKIELLQEGVDVGPLQRQLELNPHLWGANDARTRDPSSPHHGTQDIWARFADPETMQPDGSHVSKWYPAADFLPMVKVLAEKVLNKYGTKLGGVLITRIPPGESVKPHTDPGWHARHYEKYAISVEANSKQAFKFHGEELITKPGDLFRFDNSHEHWVTNDSDETRITLIICIRR